MRPHPRINGAREATHSHRSIPQWPSRSAQCLLNLAAMSIDGFVALSAMALRVRQATFEPVKMCTGYRTASLEPHSELGPRDLCWIDKARKITRRCSFSRLRTAGYFLIPCARTRRVAATRSLARVTFLPSIALLLGFFATVALILASGPYAIFQLLSQVKWWLPWLIPLRALSLLLDVAGWRVLIIAPCRLLK